MKQRNTRSAPLLRGARHHVHQSNESMQSGASSLRAAEISGQCFSPTTPLGSPALSQAASESRRRSDQHPARQGAPARETLAAYLRTYTKQTGATHTSNTRHSSLAHPFDRPDCGSGLVPLWLYVSSALIDSLAVAQAQGSVRRQLQVQRH